jgi:hypothetical protein
MDRLLQILERRGAGKEIDIQELVVMNEAIPGSGRSRSLIRGRMPEQAVERSVLQQPSFHSLLLGIVRRPRRLLPVFYLLPGSSGPRRAKRFAMPQHHHVKRRSVPSHETVRAAMHAYILEGVAGGKPTAGIELEFFAFDRDWRRIGPPSVVEFLRRYAFDHGGTPVFEGPVLARVQTGCGSLSYEPGGQLEFATSPSASLASLEVELRSFAHWLADFSRGRYTVVVCGYDPISAPGETPWCSKPRFDILAAYLSRRGPRWREMMCHTAAIQVNLSY